MRICNSFQYFFIIPATCNYRMIPGKAEVKKEMNTLTSEVIIDIVCDVWGVRKGVFKIKTRKREIIRPKYAAIYFIELHLQKLSYKRIGMMFNNIDHSTVIYAKSKVCDLIKKDFEFKVNFERVATKINDLKKGL